jgi:hypothetical protein
MPVVYCAVARFDPSLGDHWDKYIAWSGLFHLREIVSLDSMLCSSVMDDLVPEDWDHNVQEDYKTHLFRNLDYLLTRIDRTVPTNVLALIENPEEAEVRAFRDPRFRFRGYDLVELATGISALVNCGGFHRAFQNSDLSDCGLLLDRLTALEVQGRLSTEYPDEPHAECDLWAVWQMTDERSQH